MSVFVNPMLTCVDVSDLDEKAILETTAMVAGWKAGMVRDEVLESCR